MKNNKKNDLSQIKKIEKMKNNFEKMKNNFEKM